ncbi:DUF1848 domain-containing protein [Oscillospiraceae bacterium 38-13]
MILSASRRTDIPNYWTDWFFRRLEEGFVYVRNPINARQISRIELSPEVVDCIVFWSKNPSAMAKRLDELEGYSYYFQYTITGYGKDVEPGLPDKKAVLIPVFQDLSRRLGPRRVVWRYDPILFSSRYTPEYHLRAFEEIAQRLEGYGERVVISFVDLYAKTRRSTAGLNLSPPPGDGELLEFAGRLAGIAGRYGFAVESCAERIDLQAAGIRHGSCIDKALIEEITGCGLRAGKDKNQRLECGCFESIDIGAYNTCRNGCLYCYATFNPALVERQTALYDPNSPLLCGVPGPEDVIRERSAVSLRDGQTSLF